MNRFLFVLFYFFIFFDLAADDEICTICCDKQRCDDSNGAPDVLEESCWYKCNSFVLASECDHISFDDALCFVGKWEEDYSDFPTVYRRCKREYPAHLKDKTCGVPYAFGDKVVVNTCQGSELCSNSNIQVVSRCEHEHGNSMTCKCKKLEDDGDVYSQDDLGHCTYGFKQCVEGKYLNPETENCEDFPGDYCVDEEMDCDDRNCFKKFCIDNRCVYEKDTSCSDNDPDTYCDIKTDSCFIYQVDVENHSSVSDLRACRVESGLDFTEYKDHVFFKNPFRHRRAFIQYFEIYAAKSTHDKGDWVLIMQVPYVVGDDHLYDEVFDPVEKELLFHPDAYKVRFVTHETKKSLFESTIVQKKTKCQSFFP